MTDHSSSPFVADSALFRAVEERAVQIDCPGDRILFQQGDDCSGLYVLQSGSAKLDMRSHLGEVVARFEAGAGSLLGLPAVISGGEYSLTATALGGSKVGFVTRESFLNVTKSDPALALKSLQVVAAETQAARAALVEALSRQRAAKRGENGADS